MYTVKTISLILCICLFSSLSAAAEETASPLVVPAVWTAREAVNFARTNSPDSRSTRQRIQAAQAMVQQARSAFYPQVGISTQYSQTDNPMYSFGNILNQGAFDQSIDFNNPGRTDDLNTEAVVQYRLYNGGGNSAGLEMAEASQTAVEMDYDTLQSRLAYEVVRAFFTIIQARDTLQARQSEGEAIGAAVAVATARHAAGDLLRTELLNLEVQESGARENLLRAEHGLELSQRGFLNLLGLENSTVTLDETPDVPPLPVSFNRRPELQSLDARVRAAEARLAQAESERYPKADLFASYRLDNGYETDGSGSSWMGGIKLSYNLFDGNRTSAAIAESEARLSEVREQRRKMELAINLEIEQAQLALHLAEESLKVTGKMVELAFENARLTRERFKEGVVLSSDLIDVENRLTDAQVRWAVSKAARRIALADLRRAAGLSQFEQTTGLEIESVPVGK